MAKTKALFLSDIHLSTQERYNDTDFPSKYNPELHTPRLVGFLEKYLDENKASLKDVVLLGDIFDTWACPAVVQPPTINQIAQSNPEVIQAFKDIISAGVRLLFVEGNHDHESDSSLEKIGQLLEGLITAKHYLNGRIFGVHGHTYDIFNKLDYYTDPAHGRPIGYFITRLSNTIPGGADALRNIPAYFDDLLEAVFTEQNLFSSMIEALAEQANLSENHSIVLPDDNSVSVGELKTRYRALNAKYNFEQIVANVYERRYMDVPADRLCQEKQYKIVVFGHTHKNYIDKDWLFVDDRIYANSGSWCTDEAHCVEVDHRPGKSSSVTLYRADQEGAYESIGKASV